MKHLPQHGAVGWALGALQAQVWQNTEELLATIAELVHENTRVFVMANSKSKPPEPLKIPRPLNSNAKPANKRKPTGAELAAMFGKPPPPPTESGAE